MHTIEPFWNWREYYIASHDKLSPFFGTKHSQFHFTHKIYNYLIHPQWDSFGSETLYCKIIFADYENRFEVIEFIGEWNDAISNDIMNLKRRIIDPMIKSGIVRFVLIGENVLNFHASDDLYYEEWYEDIKEEGWIVALNFREHVAHEMHKSKLHYYINIGEGYNQVEWRKFKPRDIPALMENLIVKSLQ